MKPVRHLSPPSGLPAPLARLADWASNGVERTRLPFDAAAAGLFLADLHCDTLLWGVDPHEARGSGHVDVPRLKAARMGLQVFAAPTWTPLPVKTGAGAHVAAAGFDQVGALFPLEVLNHHRREGPRRRARALAIAERFHQMLRDGVRGVFSAEDLSGEGLSGEGLRAMLALEGLHWLAPDTDAAAVAAEVAALKAAGYRMMAPTHRFTNGMGGSSEAPDRRPGLTPAGRAMIRACLDQGIVVDLAHASSAVIREVCGIALSHGPKPVIVSHCGLRAVHDQPRNLTASDIRMVAATGGLVGVGFWRSALGFHEKDPFADKMARVTQSFAAALAALSEPDFVEEMTGRFGRYDPLEHLAFGSDFDGAVVTPFDVTGVSHVVAALKADLGLSRDHLALVAGENARRVLAEGLKTC